jgi:2-desacetyl-2-hydroxyethyl bacteriochlorophyllide A dehydrogenase
MRAAVLTDQRPELRLETVPDPEPEGDDVVLRVDGCGICGSDLHIAAAVGDPGAVLGHEITGTVEAHGPGADRDRWPIGTQVVARPLVGCGTCSWCTGGRPDHCDHSGLVGLDKPGGFAEMVTVSGRELFAAPTGLAAAERALVEPMAVARHALRRGGFQPGEPVLVLGGGPIGLGITAWARTLGAGPIIVSEPTQVRRELATTLGADLVVDPTDTDLMAAVADELGEPPGLVVECSGAPGLIAEGIWQTAIDGRVLVVGICLTHDEIFPFFGIQKEVDVRFALYYGPEDFVDTIAALDDRSLDAASMITQTISLDELPARFAQMVAAPDAGKVVLVP